jgi:hypothetical protein
MPNPLYLTLFTAMLLSASSASADWMPQPLEGALERAAALEACPAAVRDRVGIYLLTSRGYELDRPSGNGFHAIVERSQRDAFEPQCLDAEGSATLLDRMLLRGRLQMSGASSDEIAREIGRAWDEGRLRAPGRTGINYMLSSRNRVPVGPDTVIPYRPHVMFYAPYLRNEDVGGGPAGAGSPVFVINEGEPSAYVIVPVATESEGPAQH